MCRRTDAGGSGVLTHPTLDLTDTAGKGFAPVSASHPCPICHKPDWCLAAADGTAVICARTEAGSVKRSDAGWLHRLFDGWFHPLRVPLDGMT